MLKVPQSSSKLKPHCLLMPKNQRIHLLIFFTQSDKSFWIREKDNDWEEVIITKAEHSRSGYSEYYSNKKGYEKIVYSYFERSRNLLNNSYGLDKLPLSVEKLEEIGITSKLELDLSEISKTQADAEKQKEKENKSSAMSRFHKNRLSAFDWFFNEFDKELEGATSSSDKLACLLKR
jgi:hypothetical protein